MNSSEEDQRQPLNVGAGIKKLSSSSRFAVIGSTAALLIVPVMAFMRYFHPSNNSQATMPDLPQIPPQKIDPANLPTNQVQKALDNAEAVNQTNSDQSQSELEDKEELMERNHRKDVLVAIVASAVLVTSPIIAIVQFLRKSRESGLSPDHGGKDGSDNDENIIIDPDEIDPDRTWPLPVE